MDSAYWWQSEPKQIENNTVRKHAFQFCGYYNTSCPTVFRMVTLPFLYIFLFQKWPSLELRSSRLGGDRHMRPLTFLHENIKPSRSRPSILWKNHFRISTRFPKVLHLTQNSCSFINEMTFLIDPRTFLHFDFKIAPLWLISRGTWIFFFDLGADMVGRGDNNNVD